MEKDQCPVDYYYHSWSKRWPTRSATRIVTSSDNISTSVATHQRHCRCNWIRRRILAKLCRTTIVIVLTLTILVNLIFILEFGYKSKLIISDEPTSRANISDDGQSYQYLTLDIVSSQSRAAVSVDGAMMIDDNEVGKGRGIHVLVLNQRTGAVMARQIFDTYSPHEDEAMSLFVNLVSKGRIIVMTIKDEGSFHLKQPARDLLQRFGSKNSQILGWRDTWIFVFQKEDARRGGMCCEHLGKSSNFLSWGQPLLVTCKVRLSTDQHEEECQWPDTEENQRRREFCSRVEGYGSVCDCHQPTPITFQPSPIPSNQIRNVPVAIIASDRPRYLYRMLRSLLRAGGANKEMMTVFIDGYYEEPMQVVRLFGLKGIQHKPLGIKNARISQHYKASLSTLFKQHPDSRHAILVEEDLDVAPDFFHYFSQLVHLLDEDPTLYCVSAWNDHGYQHSSVNATLLYRVETMPGLGWMLSRKLFKEELEPAWPTQDKMWDWDMWMRKPSVRRDRECVIPDVPRTYHFGASGLNMNSFFQDTYFRKRALNNLADVQLHDIENMKAINYERVIETAVSNATLLDHTISPCEESFIPNVAGETFVMYMKMEHARDTVTWLQIAKCFKIWDLDARGSHKGLWRFYLKNNSIVVVGVPFSPYSKFKPTTLNPMELHPAVTTRKTN
ncbi:protein O-linked-mannose beta-1,2-N-acetylglucosaminyltransferase 1-like [Daphnia carinata]|uniref:protein O-linked-mannose beta-1,2-N-acetylglucosaminyltransferase 1-like n=1 Tax=Daphnia carinata TaxID=120202 RepID=UPI002580DC46|nr:protein O-linked-mannose beta-1,2-N-acetylglucosaminyltransferase 1-like [Daphnia carinata]XP_059351448.1 protein O-linked-mannose beta-1,2-N-acetylglucosaminyltransferase 1-like [Daphnia carinata]